MDTRRATGKFPIMLQPRSVAAVAVTVGLMMIGSALYELHQSRTELFRVVQQEAISLSESISRGSENILRSQELIEDLVYQRLFASARAIALADSVEPSTPAALRTFATSYGLFRIDLVNRRGERILSSHPPDARHRRTAPTQEPLELLEALLTGATDSLILGSQEAQDENDLRYSAAVRRLRPGSGAIVVSLDAREFLEFRRSVGIGRLITDLGDNSGIEYVVLQDEEGILSASRSVVEMSSIGSEPLLEQAVERDTVITRVTGFAGTEVFEVVRPLRLDGEFLGLIRIGLSMEEIRATEARMQRRIGLMTLVVAFIAVLAVSAVMATQNYRVLSRRHAAYQSMTGDVLEHMQDAVVSVDDAGRITLFNARAESLFGARSDSILNRPLAHLPPELGCLQKIFDDTAPELTIVCGGMPRAISISRSTVRLPDGRLEARTAVLRDLTEQKRIEETLRRKEKLSAMGELASGVAHEIRNPINAISMIAQRLRNEFTPRSDESEYQQITEVIRTQVERINRIIQQFLRFARPAPLSAVPLPVDDVLGAVAALFQSQATAHGLTFRVSNQCHQTATVDRDQLMQALLNLLQNALHATPGGGTISLLASCAGNTLILSVQDSGRGIPPEQLDRIFNLYYTTKPEGTGMGLAITQQIIAQHGGTITAASTPGRGSTFTVTLPGVIS